MYSVLEELDSATKPLPAARVAAIFGISLKTLYARVEAGEWPAIKIGRDYRFCPATLSHWVRKQHPDFAKAARESAKEKR